MLLYFFFSCTSCTILIINNTPISLSLLFNVEDLKIWHKAVITDLCISKSSIIRDGRTQEFLIVHSQRVIYHSHKIILRIYLGFHHHEFTENNFSNLPSVLLFQKQELAVCKPAPFFCMMTHVTA